MNNGKITKEGSYADVCQSEAEVAFLTDTTHAQTPKPLFRDISMEVESWKESNFVGLQPAEEDRQTGSISSRLYWKYMTAGITPLALILLAIVFIFVQGKTRCQVVISNHVG